MTKSIQLILEGMKFFVINTFLVYVFMTTCFNGYLCTLSKPTKHLHDTDLQLLSYLKKFIVLKKERLKTLIRPYQNLQSIFAILTYDSNDPIIQFTLKRSWLSEWKNIATIMRENNQKDFLKFYSKIISHKMKDLKHSAEILLQLQSFYRLDTQQLLRGSNQNVSSNYLFSHEDCYYMGKIACNKKKYYYCCSWMKVVFKNIDQYPLKRKTNIFNHLLHCLTKLKLYNEAVEFLQRMIQLQPLNATLHINFETFKSLMRKQKKVRLFDEMTLKIQTSPAVFNPSFAELCRMPDSVFKRPQRKNLKCFYWTNHKHPKLLLQPLKLEQLWKSPRLVRFYDVISDDDVTEIVRLATPKLKPSKVLRDGKGRELRNRISRNAWLRDDEASVVLKLNRRISCITGLSLDSSEMLQVANYGVGGRYFPHVDYLQGQNMKLKDGDRIATFLLYLNDVRFGGSTVFTHPGITVAPIKGSGVFWYNLLPSGKGNSKTRHAACPVFIGTKWVTNKWFLERGQPVRTCPKKDFNS